MPFQLLGERLIWSPVKDKILHPHQIVSGLVETALRFAFAQLIFKHAGGLFKDLPPVLGLAVNDLLYPPLPNNGVDLQTGARI